MKPATITAVADVHIHNIAASGGRKVKGLNNRAHWTLDALRGAVEVANQTLTPLVILGDLFDVNNPTPAILAEVQDILEDARFLPHILVGNHDMTSVAPNDNACAPLREFATIWSSPGFAMTHSVGIDGSVDETAELWMIPFRPGPARDWLRDDVKGLHDKRGESTNRIVLCIHLGIADDTTPAYLEGHDDTIHIDDLRAICSEFGVHDVLAGNWHWRQEWALPTGGRVIQCGTLAPVRYSDDGFEGVGGVQIVGPGDTYEYRHVPGPRFASAGSAEEAISLVTEAQDIARPLFLRLQFEPGPGDLEQIMDPSSFVEIVLRVEPPVDDEDQVDLDFEVENLSNLPIDTALVTFVDEVASERSLDVGKLRSVIDEIWRGV